MNVEIGAEDALFPEKEYIKGIYSLKISTPLLMKTLQMRNETTFSTIFLA
jgi:hypothetical protein